VVNITEGSVVADVVIQTPADWSPTRVNDAAATLSDPAAVFDAAFLNEWDITGVTVTVLSELPPRASGLSKEATIGVGVGAGVGGALAIGGVAAFVIARKRRATVEPRDRMV
jgi:hypothetical protein